MESYACILKIFVVMDKELSINYFFLLEYVLHQKNRNKEYYYYEHTKQLNEFQYQSTHQDLLYKSHPLFLVDYL